MQARLRPTVDRVSPCTPDEIFERVRDFHIRCVPTAVQVRMGQSHLAVELPEEQMHFWSPWLDLHVRPHPEGSLVTGRFAPSAPVWTMFMAIYASFAFAVFFAVSLATAQWLMGTPQWGWWLALGGLVGWGLTYVAALVGQGLGDGQTKFLEGFLNAALDDAADRNAEE